MKRSKLSDGQIIDAVKRVESGIGVPDICRELGVSVMTHHFLLRSSRKHPQTVNRLKIETSISLEMRVEEVEIYGKPNCWHIG